MTALLPIEKHLVSTIIPVYNRAAFLQQAVACVLEQTYRPIQIIISDDGSTDETPTVARDLQRQHPDIVEYVRNDNRGPGPAREAGRQRARGEFIQYLDSDDYLHPEKFERQIAALREHPECGIAYGRTRLIDLNGNVLQESYKRLQNNEFIFPRLLVDRWWCTHTPLYRREICDCIGSWSDLRYSQDWEYDARAGALGTKLVFVDRVVSDHRDHSDPQRQTGKGHWLAPEDQVRFFQSIYSCAVEAGVSPDSPEMRHFVRWVFTCSRAAGASGTPAAARRLMRIAQTANGKRSVELALYCLGARLIGWHTLSSVLEGGRRLMRRRTGSSTLRQSWMEPRKRE